MQIIGYTQKNSLGLPKIVYGNFIVNVGLSFSKYEIQEGGTSRVLRIDGIIAASPKRIRQLLRKLDDIAFSNACGSIVYRDDTPTDAQIDLFVAEGYKRKDYGTTNTELEKTLLEEDGI